MKKEIRIGIAFFVGLFLLYFGVKFLKGFNIFKPSNEYVSSFSNVSGLNVSSPILMNGFKVGTVSEMAIDPNDNKKVVVFIAMDKGIEISKGSKLKLDVSMLGASVLLLEMNPYTKEIASANDTLMGYTSTGMMDEIRSNMLPQMISLLPKVDTILTSVQALLSHPALKSSLVSIDETSNNLRQATQSLNLMMANLNKQLPSITNNLASSSAHVSQMTSRFNKLEFEKAFSKIDSTMSNIRTVSAKFTSKDNSLGLLLNDRQLYDSLNTAIGHTSGLLEDFKKNPKKYINLKVF